MYNFTHINLTIRPLLAVARIECEYCIEKEGSAINKNEEFICLDGFRTYERMGRIDGKKGLVPYIPPEIFQRLPLVKRLPEEFKHFIVKRKICKQCFAKFCRTASIETPSVMKVGATYGIEFKNTKRLYVAKLDYVCMGCRVEIKPGDIYVRFGNYRNCCCPSCVSRFEGILGTEYAS